MKTIIIEHQLPAMELAHNRSHGVNYVVTISAKKKQRQAAYDATIRQINTDISPFLSGIKLKIICYVYWNTKRRVDLLNIADAAKSQVDGMFLALKQDDYCIDDIRMIRCIPDKLNPRLVYEIKEMNI
jgi:hypothetical protein